MHSAKRLALAAALAALAASLAACGGDGSSASTETTVDPPPQAPPPQAPPAEDPPPEDPPPEDPPPEDPPPEDPPPEDPPPEDPPDSEPATDVAGTWEPQYVGSAASGSVSVLSGCSGDLVNAEGEAALPMGLACASDDPIVIVQDGATFEIQPITCIGEDAEAAGSGTVTSDQIEGRFEVSGPDEVQAVLFTGTVAVNQVTLTANRVEVSGARAGACDIAPPTTSVVLIAR